ncbi:hypothetical protein BPUTSESOX_1003 [uncultured Gammaproteobacteria bacterium]|jgi:uncharacterized Tic20 family protein|uniref:PGPGW domain-containing protein n=1 Tax=thiotrophic endosymbiont of Bathymodiolus puteoserpentis (Logatchev) TaxID=343240 RepID=UPI0010AF7C3F|nr:PGPGW domain-containing protein [thiotrophic endosymbiont of Bathymodiolus puteoserpentis (Logatchev)]CAC9566570.1 hypothetical protein [uncultured Gammaproteobacteria bacterium]CAC9572060.1 hypothetical protein [uncultured Gammaproteobacteria bacterium]CAC9581198.1 hypothetical protein [uncultured Gammaproteobacteria bacterium]CAC9660020.1 hypothetical protein [uncultured Gammaproteobacteria bacterium]CAC9978495.1 hypothetical protein [uncultured Gammaproteobacteria bacterium]
MLDFINKLIIEYEEMLLIVGIISGIVFVVSLLAMPFLLGKIPVDYFSQSNQCKRDCNFVVATIKNLVGLVLLLAGIIMLVTPGQGIISILLGLFLMEFPGKRKLELKLISNDTTFQAINWLRNKAGAPPLER